MIPKFRAWHLNREKMRLIHKMEWSEDYDQCLVYVQEDIGINDTHHLVEVNWLSENIKIMQFTQAYDKYNEEIFEGDILEVPLEVLTTTPYLHGLNKDIKILEKAYVENFNGVWQLVVDKKRKESKEVPWRYHLHVHYKDQYEIIGNIYENPELLVVKKC